MFYYQWLQAQASLDRFTSTYICDKISVIGDTFIAAAILLLLYRLFTAGPAGVSIRTQCLYFILFWIRYLDLFTSSWISIYNTLFKIFYLVSSTSTLILLIIKTRALAKVTTQSVAPVIAYYIFPAFFAAVCFNYRFTVVEVAWSFSQYLFAIAEIPQLLEIYHAEAPDAWLVAYVSFIAVWKILYIPRWVARYIQEGLFDPITVVGSCVHILVFFAFLGALAWKKRRTGRIRLPEDGDELEAAADN